MGDKRQAQINQAQFAAPASTAFDFYLTSDSGRKKQQFPAVRAANLAQWRADMLH